MPPLVCAFEVPCGATAMVPTCRCLLRRVTADRPKSPDGFITTTDAKLHIMFRLVRACDTHKDDFDQTYQVLLSSTDLLHYDPINDVVQ